MRLLPADRARLAHWRRLPRFNRLDSRWTDPEANQGGNPFIGFGSDGVVSLGAMAPWKNGDPPKVPALVFHAPKAGTWSLSAIPKAQRWDGRGACKLRRFLLNSEQGEVQQLATWELEPGRETSLNAETIELAQGQRLGLVFSVDGMHSGASCQFNGLRLVRR